MRATLAIEQMVWLASSSPMVNTAISDNILLSDIYMRAKELHVAPEVPRSVFLVRQLWAADR